MDFESERPHLMIRHGTVPYLECSSRGDRRLSAFYARVKAFDNKTIEELYQAYKIFDNGVTGLSWREAKGRKALNQGAAALYYGQIWKLYIEENPNLLEVLKLHSGLSDLFGQEGHCCQATELWEIRNQC